MDKKVSQGMQTRNWRKEEREPDTNSWYSISTGMAGTLSFGLGLRDCTLVIIFFGLLTAVFAPYFSRWGPVLGLRQMIHARYSFGCVPNLLSYMSPAPD